MNAVEVEQAISGLALLPFDATESRYGFLTAFGNNATPSGANLAVSTTTTCASTYFRGDEDKA